MNERTFGFDTSKLDLKVSADHMVDEMERTFGEYGFHSSLNFSITNEI